MASDEPMVQFATRIPRKLHHALKVAVVEAEQTLQAYIAAALAEKVARAAKDR